MRLFSRRSASSRVDDHRVESSMGAPGALDDEARSVAVGRK